MLDYIRDAAEIYRQSFATIRAEADLARFPDDVARVVVRLIHTCGQVDVAEHVAFTADVVAGPRRAGRGRAGAVRLVDGGRRHHPLPAARRQRGGVAGRRSTGAPIWPPQLGTTRSAAARRAVGRPARRRGRGDRQRADRAVPAAGTARRGRPGPAAVLGGPVGFVGSAQSKQELIDRPRGMSYLVVQGRRGGSAMAAAAVNAIASERE